MILVSLERGRGVVCGCVCERERPGGGGGGDREGERERGRLRRGGRENFTFLMASGGDLCESLNCSKGVLLGKP